ncbi:MAG: type II 3-dehydroquinate dehydratase [Deltaproteobacteria bacterium]|nr:type II 3-dehydroquinate dehydratase [Deltaproteobacteria bacterium]
MMKVLFINGPNLNMLGKRERDTYGSFSWKEIEEELCKEAHRLNVEVLFFQSNHEGEIVERIQRAPEENVDFLIINAGAYTHTSIAIRDAVLSVQIPVIEVHMSNVFKREPFRQVSFLSDIAQGIICGMGKLGYKLALHAAVELKNGTPDM